MLSRTHSSCGIAIVIAALAAACGGIAPERAAANARAAGPDVLTGRIPFDGTPLQRAPLRMAGDPACKPGPESLSEATVVGPDMGLKNVFVHVKDGLGNRIYE